MGLPVASALISILCGHWPRLALLLSDWLKGRQPQFDFRVEGPVARALPPCPQGPGAHRGARRQGAGSPKSASLPSLRVGAGSPSTPVDSPVPTPPRRPLPPRSRPRWLWPPSPPSGGRGPGPAVTRPQVASRGKRESSPPGTPLPPRAVPRALRSCLGAALGLLSLAPGGPRGDCGLQPAGRFRSQKPLCSRHCSLLRRAPWDSLAFPAGRRTKTLLLCPQIAVCSQGPLLWPHPLAGHLLRLQPGHSRPPEAS